MHKPSNNVKFSLQDTGADIAAWNVHVIDNRPVTSTDVVTLDRHQVVCSIITTAYEDRVCNNCNPGTCCSPKAALRRSNINIVMYVFFLESNIKKQTANSSITLQHRRGLCTCILLLPLNKVCQYFCICTCKDTICNPVVMSVLPSVCNKPCPLTSQAIISSGHASSTLLLAQTKRTQSFPVTGI